MVLDGTVFYEKVTGKSFLDSSILARVISLLDFGRPPALLFYKRAASIVFSVLAWCSARQSWR